MDNRTVYVIPENCECGRADVILSSVWAPHKSRAAISQLIKAGLVKSGDRLIKPSTILKPGDVLEIVKSQKSVPSVPDEPCYDLEIIFENDQILVVNKPAGVVTHPGAGRLSGTLMDLAIKHRPEIRGIGAENRWGIVHRLDKDTSGVIVIAKSDSSYKSLSDKFKKHSIHRLYHAIVRGEPKTREGEIDLPIGRDTKNRKKMTTMPRKGRPAHSRWQVLETFGGYAYLEVRPQTGRTHQIRAHLASVNMPVLGDKVYGAPTKKQIRSNSQLAKLLKIMQRQALHASLLGLSLDDDSDPLFLRSELPSDMRQVLFLLRNQK